MGYRTAKKPVPTAKQEAALTRLNEGNATQADINTVRLLIDDCGRYGCAIDRLSKASPGMDECPKWCDAIEKFEDLQKKRAQQLEEHPKPRPLTKFEQKVIEDLGCGIAPETQGMLSLSMLCMQCEADGCAKLDDKHGTCPGWCDRTREAWNLYWRLPW